MAAHSLEAGSDFDAPAIEAAELARLSMPEAIAPRHGAAHFQHVFSGEGYSAGYYSYLWSEVLDADGFEAFIEAGDVFDPTLAENSRRSSIPLAIRARPRKPTPPSAVVRRSPRPCCASADLRRRSGAAPNRIAYWRSGVDG